MREIQIFKGAIKVREVFDEAQMLVTPRYWLFFVMGLFQTIAILLLSIVPLVGVVLPMFVGGPLICGIYMAFFAESRGENVDFMTIFRGFSKALPLILVGFISSLPMLIFASVKGIDGFNSENSGGDASSNKLLSFFAVYVITLFIQVIFYFSIALLADNEIGFGDAVKYSFQGVSMNLGGVVALILVQTLILICGAVACGIGIFFALPLTHAMMIISYKKVFHPSMIGNLLNMPPPPPSDFGE